MNNIISKKYNELQQKCKKMKDEKVHHFTTALYLRLQLLEQRLRTVTATSKYN